MDRFLGHWRCFSCNQTTVYTSCSYFFFLTVCFFGVKMAVIASPNTSIPDGLKVNIPHSSMLPFLFLNFFKKNYLFIYFWLHWVFVAACTFSLVAVSGGYSSLWCAGFSLRWLLLLWSMGSRRADFRSCGMWPQ